MEGVACGVVGGGLGWWVVGAGGVKACACGVTVLVWRFVCRFATLEGLLEQRQLQATAAKKVQGEQVFRTRLGR